MDNDNVSIYICHVNRVIIHLLHSEFISANRKESSTRSILDIFEMVRNITWNTINYDVKCNKESRDDANTNNNVNLWIIRGSQCDCSGNNGNDIKILCNRLLNRDTHAGSSGGHCLLLSIIVYYCLVQMRVDESSGVEHPDTIQT